MEKHIHAYTDIRDAAGTGENWDNCFHLNCVEPNTLLREREMSKRTSLLSSFYASPKTKSNEV